MVFPRFLASRAYPTSTLTYFTQYLPLFLFVWLKQRLRLTYKLRLAGHRGSSRHDAAFDVDADADAVWNGGIRAGPLGEWVEPATGSISTIKSAFYAFIFHNLTRCPRNDLATKG